MASEELGKITKPEAASFKGKRKLYLVPLLFSGNDAPEEYNQKLGQYWDQVKDHIARLEATAGLVGRIYHESIFSAGKEGLEILQVLNPGSSGIVSEKCEQGAILEALDDKELNDEIMDWERFMMMGFMSQKVANTVSEHYRQVSEKRNQHMMKIIGETLEEGESAILFIREGHALQFPSEIDVFSVSPPALDEIYRWVRDHNAAKAAEMSKSKESAEG